MRKTRKRLKPAGAEEIARRAERGLDVSSFFEKQGRLVRPNVAEQARPKQRR